MRIAVDLDSTLAEVTPVVYDLLGEEYNYDDTKTWEWPIETFGRERFLAAAWAVWPIRKREIPLSDSDAPEVIEELCEYHTVDIVTQQGDSPFVDQAKRDWLADKEIPFKSYETVSMDETKADLDYDLYLDDKPNLAKDLAGVPGVVIIYDRPYNRDLYWPHVRATDFREFQRIVNEHFA